VAPRFFLACSFCGSGQRQVGHLIAGPHVYICDRCVIRAHAVIAGQGQTASTHLATIHQVGDAYEAAQCSFCGKRRYQVAGMAAAAPGDNLAVCEECLDLCDEIISEELGEPGG
jgi:ATP-dependent protease Clp ATPase subunit